MKSPDQEAKSEPAPKNDGPKAKKSLWQQGLSKHDLDILHRRFPMAIGKDSSSKGKEPTDKKEVFKPIEVSTVEFAKLALMMAQQYGRKTPAQRYFKAADELLQLTDHFLRVERVGITAARVNKLGMDLYDGYVPVTNALRRVKEDGSMKKGVTQVGNIATEEGLLKALERLYGEGYKIKIERKVFRIDGVDKEVDAIHHSTIEAILADQKQANERRGKRKQPSADSQKS